MEEGKPAKGNHQHRCPDPACRKVWEHSDEMFGDAAAHTCPACGEQQFTRFYGKTHWDKIPA